MSDDKAATQSEEPNSGNTADNGQNNRSGEAPGNGPDKKLEDIINSVVGDPDAPDPDLQASQEAGMAEEMAAAGISPDSAMDPEDEVAVLKAQIEQASAKADENMDLALRTRAEMENLRKRQARELENAHKYALDKIAEELIPVRDTLELGVAAAAEDQAELGKIVEGTELTLKMLTQAFGKFNINEVDPVGDKFNPELHQAISVQEGTDQAADTVLTVMQKGYTLNDRLLRPAMVVIAK